MDPREYALGKDRTLIEFGTAEANRAVAQSLAVQATRTLHIFTTDLDPAVLDTPEFVGAAARMARASPRARVMVLVQDSGRAAREGHRLVQLSQRLSSRVEIRKPGPEYRDLTETFVVADGTGYLRRIVPGRYEGRGNFYDRLKSRELIGTFEEIWQRAHADRQVRRLHL